MRPLRSSPLALALLALLVAGTAPLRAQEEHVAAGSEGVPVPKKTKHVQPVYPPEALAQGIRGIVILDIVLDTRGKVETTNVLRSVPGLDEAAITAARQWEYEPTKTVDSKPVRVRLTVPSTFSLALPRLTRQSGVPDLRQGVTPAWPAGASGGGLASAEVTLEPDGRIGVARTVDGEAPWSETLLAALKLGAQNRVRAENWFPVPGMPRVPGAVSNFPERVQEGARAADDVASALPKTRAAKTSAETSLQTAKAELAAKGYDKVSDGVESILGNIDAEIAAAGRGSDKAKILTELRAKLAPDGVPLDKPYKLEGVYQETSKRLDVPINAPVQDRVAAGVLGEPVSAIKALVEETSSTIKQGRELYKEISERVVNPLTAGPVGRVAGRQGFDPSLPQNLNLCSPSIVSSIQPTRSVRSRVYPSTAFSVSEAGKPRLPPNPSG